MATSANNPSRTRAWIITGPTAGIGRRTAFELAKHGNVVLVRSQPRQARGRRAGNPNRGRRSRVGHLRSV
jgi:NAD(P)-dependent dehydrogenase (short-subunit alcohol dehydrogenase family)